MSTTIPANVERGAAFLDEHVPGWEKKVDIEVLSLANPSYCVLGQVFRVNQHPAYGRGLRKLGLDYKGSKRYGFNIRPNQRFDRLTAAWQRLIANRRGGS
jgi:hypothetical protein